MIESAGLDALQRLQQASEALQAPSAQGSLSPVPPELAREFAALMQQEVPGSTNVNPTEGARLDTPQPNASTDSSMAADSSQDLAADQPSGQSQNLQTPADLLGLQCSVNMQLFETKMMSAVRDHAAQDFEHTIKSSS